MARSIIRPLATLLMLALTGCLGGGGGGSSSQQSLGSVQYLDHSVVSYDSQTAIIKVRGSLNVSGATDLNEISVFSDSLCQTSRIGFGLNRDFSGGGIEVTLPSTSISTVYLSTNTSESCFAFFEYVPKYDAPAPPTLSLMNPTSPSRVTFRPIVTGQVSTVTTSVQFFLDSNCTVSAGSGSASQFRNAGIQLTLVAEADNEIFARAVDSFGKGSACTLLTRFLHDSSGPTAPVFVATNPASPSGASAVPMVRGTVTPDIQTVSIYTDAACTAVSGTGTAEDFRTTGIQVSAALNTSTSYYAIGTDDNMVPSDCTFLTIYVHDSVAPAPLTYMTITPTSPSRTTLVPRVAGTASSDTQQVRLFSNSTCTTIIGSGSKAVFETTGIAAGVVANETTMIYGLAQDAAGNLSSCLLLTSFQHDTMPPAAPVFALSVPASPNNSSVTPRIQGTTDIEAIDVKIYNNDTCTNLIGQGSVAAFEAPGIQVTVAGNTTTTLYGTSDDGAGNTSECGALANYAHSTVPAPAPGFFQAIPTSPTRLSNRPYIVGTAVNTITRVTMYSDAACTGTIGTASRSLFVTSGIQATVALNSQTSIYAVSEDIYGNVSACTFLVSYIHNTVPPINPIFGTIAPLSPNKVSTTPTITGTIVFDPGNILQPIEVSLYDGFLCLNKIGMGTPAQFQGAGLVASLPANTASVIYAKVFDAAGNMSDCTYLTDYTHDALVPGRPLLSAVTPATPSYTSNTVLAGNLGATIDFLPPTNLVLYSDSLCQNIIKSEPVSLFLAGTYTMPFTKNATTTLYGAVFNPVLTASPCTLLVNFVHSDIGPGGLSSFQNADGSITLNWNPDVTANPIPRYEVRRSLQSGGPYTTVAENLGGTTYTDANVTNLQTYYYVVAARNNTGVSKNSAEISRTVTVSTPSVLLGLTASASSARVSLTWVGNGENMTYSIRRSSNPGGPYSLLATNLTTTTFVDTSPINNSTYYYVVSGKNPAGESIDSNEASATPLEIPLAPTNVQLTQIPSSPDCGGGFGVLISWTPPSYHTGFTVNRGTTPTVTTPMQTTTANSWVDCNPSSGSGGPDYNYYSVTANWGLEQSAESSKVVFVYDASGTIRADPGNGAVHLSWAAVSGALRYHIYRSQQPGGPYTLLSNSVIPTAYTDSSVTNGQAYFYVMNTEYPNDGALGLPTPEQGALPGVNPEAPSNLVLTVNSNNQPVLNWTPPHAYNYFRVYRATNIGGPYSLLASPNNPGYVDTTPTNGILYYRVTRVWGVVESSPSNTVQLRYGFPGTLGISLSASVINLNWTSVSGANGYEIFRSNSTSGPFTLLDTTTNLTYSDTAVVTDTPYFYMVRATFADLTVGQFTPQVSGTTSTSTIPSGLAVTGTTPSTVSLNWPRYSGTSSYKIYRASTVGGTYLLVGQQSGIGITISGLAGATEHFFKFSFVRTGVESTLSAPVSTFTYAAPAVPVVTGGNNSILVSWGSVISATSYSVLRSTDGTNFSTIASGLTGLSHTDNSVTNGSIYFYRITAEFPVGTRTSGSSLAVTPGLTPRPPNGLVISKNSEGTELELTWAPSPGASFYRIYRSTTTGGPYTQISQSSITQSVLITGQATGTRYYYVVTAVTGSLESSYSNEAAAIPEVSPNAPVASLVGADVNLNWGAVPGASQYYILRSTDQTNFQTIAGLQAGTTYLDIAPPTATTYFYRYLPVDTAGVPLALSLVSAEVIVGILPVAPSGLVAFSTATNAVSLSWTVAPNAVDFVVLRSTVAGGPYTEISSTGSTSYLNSGLTPGLTYFYVVRSRDMFGNQSANSNEVSMRLVGAPVGLAANSVADMIQLSWGTVAGASGYSVSRSLVPSGPYGKIAQNVPGASYSDSAIKNGVTYYYVVQAEFSSETSPYSNEASAVGIRRINIQVPIELVDQSLSSDSSTLTFERTTTTLNTNDYDGSLTFEFEAVVLNSDSGARNVRLVNELNAVVSTLIVPANTSERTRLRTAFTPTPGDHRYRVQLQGTTGSGMLEVVTARVLITQVGASKSAIYIPLLSSSSGAFIGDDTGPVSATNSAAFDTMATASIYRKESANYATLISQNPWTLETLVSSTGGAIGSVALYNMTRSAHVDDTESQFTGAAIQLSRSPFQEGVTGFSTANELDSYQVAIRCVSDCQLGLAQIYKAGLWVRVENLEKAQVIFRNSLGSMPSGVSLFDHQRALLNLLAFTNPMTYFQATANVTGSNPGFITLNDVGTADSGLATPIVVGSSELTINGSGKSLYRSSVITPTSGNRFVPAADPNGSMLTITDTSIVINTSR